MAEAKKSSKKKRVLKRTETVRERASKASAPRKPRRLKRAGRLAVKPLKAVIRVVLKILRPFRFVLRPFRFRPIRFVGRILAKVLLLKYIRDSWREVRQVTWPGRRQTWQLTFAVFTFAIFFGLIIAITDYGLSKLTEKLLIK